MQYYYAECFINVNGKLTYLSLVNGGHTKSRSNGNKVSSEIKIGWPINIGKKFVTVYITTTNNS